MGDSGLWTGTRVRHRDGRTGVIDQDYVGFAHRVLRIVDAAGAPIASVQLNVDGPHSGDSGWEWESSNSNWYLLGPEMED